MKMHFVNLKHRISLCHVGNRVGGKVGDAKLWTDKAANVTCRKCLNLLWRERKWIREFVVNAKRKQLKLKHQSRTGQ